MEIIHQAAAPPELDPGRRHGHEHRLVGLEPVGDERERAGEELVVAAEDQRLVTVGPMARSITPDGLPAEEGTGPFGRHSLLGFCPRAKSAHRA